MVEFNEPAGQPAEQDRCRRQTERSTLGVLLPVVVFGLEYSPLSLQFLIEGDGRSLTPLVVSADRSKYPAAASRTARFSAFWAFGGNGPVFRRRRIDRTYYSLWSSFLSLGLCLSAPVAVCMMLEGVVTIIFVVGVRAWSTK